MYCYRVKSHRCGGVGSPSLVQANSVQRKSNNDDDDDDDDLCFEIMWGPSGCTSWSNYLMNPPPEWRVMQQSLKHCFITHKWVCSTSEMRGLSFDLPPTPTKKNIKKKTLPGWRIHLSKTWSAVLCSNDLQCQKITNWRGSHGNQVFVQKVDL